MKEIILGTEGDQPFKITNAGVSRRHAKITIDDDNSWHIEDLDSMNGTYVRDSDGTMQRVVSLEINEMTFIRLGPANVNGCCFYARQLLSPKSYTKEFQYLDELEDRFEETELRTERIAKIMRYAIAAVSILALASCLFATKNQLWALRISSILSAVTSIFYDPVTRKKKITKSRERFYQCPNPNCSYILTGKDIRAMQCPRCKAH